jgi:hypothetical protein
MAALQDERLASAPDELLRIGLGLAQALAARAAKKGYSRELAEWLAVERKLHANLRHEAEGS